MRQMEQKKPLRQLKKANEETDHLGARKFGNNYNIMYDMVT